MNYATLNARMTGRNVQRRKLANNTYAERRGGGAIAVRLHATDVVTFHADGRAVLDSGGWRTVTTKDRMNEALGGDYAGAHIWQARGVWTLSGGAVYADGMSVWPDGRTEGAGVAEPRADRATLRACRAYARGFVQALADGKVSAPSAGDCWYCAMRTVADHKPLGEATRNADHIKSHIGLGEGGAAEVYYVPSLLVRAGEMFAVSQVAHWWLAAHWDTRPEVAEDAKLMREGSMAGVARQQWESAIYRYVKRQLGFAG